MAGFHKGWSGSSLHTGTKGNEGPDINKSARDAKGTISPDSGAEGRRVTANYAKTTKGGSSKKR